MRKNKVSNNYTLILGKLSRHGVFRSLHIGKSSGIRSFSFHGYDIPAGFTNTEVGYGANATIYLPKLRLTTYDQWMRFLRWELNLKDAKIVDEYNQEMSYEEFMNFLQNKGNFAHHYASDYYGTEPRAGGRWTDSKGYCFSGYEFS